jgi:hypothetical protein
LGEENFVKGEGPGGGAGDGEMAEVRWIEAAAEEPDAHDL